MLTAFPSLVFAALLSYIQGSFMMLAGFVPLVALIYFRGMSRIKFAINNKLGLPLNATPEDTVKFYTQLFGGMLVNFGLLILAVVASVTIVVLYSVF